MASVYAIESDEVEEISVVKVQAVKEKAVREDTRQAGTRQISNRLWSYSANILRYKYEVGVYLTLCSQSLVMWNGNKVKPVDAGALPTTSLPGRRESGNKVIWEGG